MVLSSAHAFTLPPMKLALLLAFAALLRTGAAEHHNLEFVVEHARATGRLLVVDECRRAGALGEAVLAGVALAAPGTLMELVAGVDTYVPLGPPMQLVLPQEADVVAAARKLMAD